MKKQIYKSPYDPVIGIELVTPGGGFGTWKNINRSGGERNFKDESSRVKYFNSHPIWGEIRDEIIADQYMVRIPKFYFKNINHRKLWISPTRLDDTYKCHPAFMKNGEEMDCFWIGKYLGNGYSSPSRGSSQTTRARLLSLANSLNTNGITGFCNQNIYMWSALQLLFLIEHESPDINKLGTLTNNTTEYRHVANIYGSYAYGVLLDGLVTNSSRVLQIFDNMGNGTYVTTSQSMPTYQAGSYYCTYPTVCSIRTGNGYDLKDIFIGDPSVDAFKIGASSTAGSYGMLSGGFYAGAFAQLDSSGTLFGGIYGYYISSSKGYLRGRIAKQVY